MEKLKVEIINSADGRASTRVEVTRKQYDFLDNLFDGLNNCREDYAPHIYMKILELDNFIR